ncbi:AI-2E family transporter [Pseudaestuariivita sp.]|uniref:AI-2E family transporter n=1 Tax=Pseudaestuariivita sp. TaxID=2211669 RepID=UPI004059CD01
MGLPVQDQLKYWGIAAAVFMVLLWALGDVLLPFVLGGAIAYCMDPIADRLQRMGLSRGAAVGVITLTAVLLSIVILIPAARILVSQAVQLFEVAPQLFDSLQRFVDERVPKTIGNGIEVPDTFSTIGDTIRSRGGQLVDTLIGSVSGLVNVLVLFLIVPVVAVYLLVDWDNMIAKIDEMLPRDHAPTIRTLAADIDKTLSAFIRGMGSVCLILGTYYAVALMLVGLQFGLIVGFVAGLLTFIPYVGAIIGGALALGLALFQFWGDWMSIVIVAVIFQVGQLIEGNVLTPKLVGSSVGLHPVWLLLALSVFGSLFGFVGMLVAVPLAAAIGVVARFGVAQYKHSRLYRGLETSEDEPQE